MRYEVKCSVCGHVIWVGGWFEADVNALELNDSDPAWDEACEHLKHGGDYEIGESEPMDDGEA